MAAGDATWNPKKNVAYRVTFPILDADGDLVSGATGLDSEVSKDGGTFTDCTNEATEIATSSGVYYIDLTATEMNADTVAIIVKTTSSGAKTTVLVFYPLETTDTPVDVLAISGDTVAADNLEAAADGTGYNLGGGTIVAASVTAAVTANTTQWGGVAVTGMPMPSYTQPTGFLAATFPTTVASTTNITAASGVSIATAGITSTSFAAGAIDAAAMNVTGSEFTAIPWNSAWDTEVQSEVQDAIEVNHLDHLLAVTYDPASPVGVADSLMNDLVEDNGAGVTRFTTTALEQAPSGGGGGGTDWTTDERTQIRQILGVATSGTTPTDPTTGILDTIRDLVVTVDTVADRIEVDTQDIQGRLPAALVSGRIDASVGAMAANVLTASALATDAVGKIADGIWDEAMSGHTTAGTYGGRIPRSDTGNVEVRITGTGHTAAVIHDLQPAVIDNTHFAAGAIDANALAASAASEIATAVYTGQMTESYRAAGVAPTLAQAMFELVAQMGDSAISGTTKTLKKIDGTAAKTFTLDSATTPTSITEAT